MHVLITGGAGYIGSHTAKQILEHTNHQLTIIDNLSTGNIETIHTLQTIRSFAFVEQDLNEFSKIDELLTQYSFDAIIHFAASIVVPESVSNPAKYYLNNTVNTTSLVHLAVQKNIKKFIFSSTAAVYGEPESIPKTGITEEFTTLPINPYGSSKLMSEQILQDICKVNAMKFVIFRYFNVAGADIHYTHNALKPRIGQKFPDATHLIKVATEVATRKRKSIAIFGTDFPTRDGTGVRDYIHVDDLAYAHLLAIHYLETNASNVFNIGYGAGYSVREVLTSVSKIKDISITKEGRRLGDPSELVANNAKIMNLMNWQPKYNDIDLICQSAYEWERGMDKK